MIKVTVDRDKMQSKLDDRDEELVALKEKYEEVYQLYSETKLKYTQSEGNSSNMIYRVEELEYQLNSAKERLKEFGDSNESLKNQIRNKENEVIS